MIFYQSISGGPGALWQALTHEQALHAFRLTFIAAGIVTLTNIFLGTIAAFALVRFRFPGRKILNTLIELPFAIPTAVIGLTLASLLGPKSPIGAFLQNHGFSILYHPSAIYIAFMVVTLPFIIRAVEPLLRSMDPAEEEAAYTLGANALRTFFSVVLPVIRPGILSGAVLTFARSLGEFGAVVFVAGTEAFHTEVAATYIFSRIEQFDFRGGAAASVVVLTVSYFLLWIMRFLETPPEERQKT
jgi:sulfate transport system permease protein